MICGKNEQCFQSSHHIEKSQCFVRVGGFRDFYTHVIDNKNKHHKK
jgi:hypothetical protein